MNDPTSNYNENDFGLEGRVRDVAPGIMTSGSGRDPCIGCQWRATYGGCLNPYNLKKKQ